MTITFSTIWIPSIITLFALGWAIAWFIKDSNKGGYLSGLDGIFAMIPALLVSLIAWVVYAVLK